MAAYTIQQFIDRAMSGAGVSISASVSKVDLQIDGTPITIKDPIDIGKFFSARQVLESYPLRAAIVDGALVAGAGTTSLSATPTKAVS